MAPRGWGTEVPAATLLWRRRFHYAYQQNGRVGARIYIYFFCVFLPPYIFAKLGGGGGRGGSTAILVCVHRASAYMLIFFLRSRLCICIYTCVQR